MAACGSAAVGQNIARMVDVEAVVSRRQAADGAGDFDAVDGLHQIQSSRFSPTCNIVNKSAILLGQSF